MSQLALFDSTDQVLTDDDRGRITYSPRLVDAATADAWFTELRTAVKWRGERRMMYDCEVDVPRLMGHFRLDPPSPATPRSVLDAARQVTDRLDVLFNTVGLNLYRDGRDSVAPHNDNLNELREGFPIALVSLDSRRPGAGKPARDGLRDADSLHPRRAEDERAGGGAYQPRIPSEASPRRSIRQRRNLSLTKRKRPASFAAGGPASNRSGFGPKAPDLEDQFEAKADLTRLLPVEVLQEPRVASDVVLVDQGVGVEPGKELL
jgi:alkylated DNA repair dioxygenase AlkB